MQLQSETKNTILHLFIIDYDYDFYGYSDYRGGYNESYYEDCYRSFEGDCYFEQGTLAATQAQGGQRSGRANNSVGFLFDLRKFCGFDYELNVLTKLVEQNFLMISLQVFS